METITIQRLADHTNCPVLRLSGSKTPGVLIQGDTLAIIYSMLETALKTDDPDQRAAEVSYVQHILADFVVIYEDALADHGIKLPYNPDMTASAKGL